jgi:hypothetical protein
VLVLDAATRNVRIFVPKDVGWVEPAKRSAGGEPHQQKKKAKP